MITNDLCRGSIAGEHPNFGYGKLPNFLGGHIVVPHTGTRPLLSVAATCWRSPGEDPPHEKGVFISFFIGIDPTEKK